MTKYMTKQRQTLLTYLAEHPDQQLSAKQIAAGLEATGVSLSAVYRNLSVLEAEGKIKRYSRAGARDAFYQYIAAPACVGCLHLSCTSCGRTFHMDAGYANALVERIAKDEEFLIDRGDTVLYGVCRACKRGGKGPTA